VNVTYATSIFTKILNVNNAVLYVALPASIVFILLTITAAPYVVFSESAF
jgi:hypothetical protein